MTNLENLANNSNRLDKMEWSFLFPMNMFPLSDHRPIAVLLTDADPSAVSPSFLTNRRGCARAWTHYYFTGE